MNKIIYISLFILLVNNSFGQYIPLMNGYFKSNQFYNPAAAGMNEHLVGYTGLRKQWVKINGAPSTQMLAFDSPMSNQRHGLGGIYYRDKIGVTTTNGLQFNYAYRTRISRKMKLSFGVNFGLENIMYNISEIDLIDKSDQTFSKEFGSSNKVKIGAGAMLYDKKMVIGLSINDLIKQDKFGNILAYAQYKKKLNREWVFLPGLLLKANYMLISQAELSLQMSYQKQISFSLGFRTNGSIIAGVGFKPTKQLLVMYYYDYIAGRLRKFTSGSHELTLKYDFIKQYRSSSPRF